MSHRVAQLFAETEEKVEAELARLEAATGHQGHDLRLLNQDAQLARARIAELDLDPDDTTPAELYHSLRSRYQSDASQFEAALGLSRASAEDKRQQAMEITRQALEGESAWVIRPAVLKSLLKQASPTKTMKLLHYRTIDSMLKRTNPAVVLAVAYLAESATWQAKWTKLTGKQTASSYESSSLRFVSADLPKGMPDLKVSEAATIVVSSADPPDMLGQVLRAIVAAEEMLSRDYNRQLGQVHPALRWWNANAHLVAWIDGDPVSFNIYDVANDHYSKSDFDERDHQWAASKLLQGLTNEYQKFLSEIDSQQLIPIQPKATPVMVAAEVEDV
jgi:hypothetical protein